MTPQPGQITRIVEVATPDGAWRAAAEVYTGEESPPILGYLYAPQNGTEGGVVFRPAAELEGLATAEPEPKPAVAAMGGGTLTSEGVPRPGVATPSGGPNDPDDPRGLRR